MDVGKISVPFEAVAKSKTCHLVGVSPLYNYVDGRRGNEAIGVNYEVVLTRNGFEKLRVKIEGSTQPIISNEEILAAGTVEVEFSEFVGRIYNTSGGRADISARAKAISIVAAKKV